MPATLFFQNHNRAVPNNAGHSFPHGVAYFSAARWWYSGLNFGGSTLAVPITDQDVGAIKVWIGETFGDLKPLESTYRPGTAYRRISLPLNTVGSMHNAVDTNALTQSFVALKLLLTKMQDFFETVDPAEGNMQAYSHKIRELLLLAAMEVEAPWTAVLRANGYAEPRPTTKDDVKLLAPMLLDGFGLKLRSYPEFPLLTPYKGWSVQAPTQSLGWYDALSRTFLISGWIIRCIQTLVTSRKPRLVHRLGTGNFSIILFRFEVW